MTIHEGQLGIHPPSALGVAFFVHAEAECFLGRGGVGITQQLKEAGRLRLRAGHGLRTISLGGRIFSNLLEADALDRTPELVMVCCNPDQLSDFTAHLTRFLENLAERGRLRTADDIRRCVPILLIMPNGILAEQALRTYEEQLRESLLMGRLPDLTEASLPILLDRVVRGIALQAGGRRGQGRDTVYVQEKKGSLIFAGGGEAERDRIESVLATHGYPATHVRDVPAARIEFDKAMISTVLNVGGLIHTVSDSGELRDLRMGDLCKDSNQEAFVRRVTRAVFEVGRAVGAYDEKASYEDVWATHRATIMKFAGHVTSSLKLFRDRLADGLDGVQLFPNEEWILTPLCRYAAKAGLTEEETLFVSLRRQVQQAMARAIRFRDQRSSTGDSRTEKMKLATQRNFTIELYDAGPDDMLLVGTMLDNEHLIKLEIHIDLTDEQITRSRLDMIRVPFPVCREVETVAERLVGLRIERGVIGEVNRRVGGRVGCSHIKELANNIIYFAAAQLVRHRIGIDPVSTDYARKPPEERFMLTRGLLRDSCLAYCQTTPQGLDERIGIKRVRDAHSHPLPLGDYESSLGVLLKNRVARWHDRVYLRERGEGRTQNITWGAFGASVSQIARHLMEQGIHPGDRIAMLSENRSEMFLFEMAVMAIGAVTVPIFAGYPPAQVAYVLGHARPRMVVVSGPHQLDKIVRDHFPWVRRFYCMDFDASCEAWGATPFATLTKEGGCSEEEFHRRMDSVRPDDLCVVMYTSGTTGPPKGVKLSHRNLISQQKAISLIWDIHENDVFLSYLPWHHSFGGLFERFLTLYQGCELCLDHSRGRNLDVMLANWRVFDPTIFFSVPRVHDQLVRRGQEDATADKLLFGGRLRQVFTAGAPLPASVAAAYREHQIPVLEGWGLTETSPCVTVTTKDGGWKNGYVGFPIPGVQVRIDSSQELLVKGPNVMAGYLDNEEDTAYVIDDEGWFHSGDLGEFTDEGFRLFGRKDGTFKLTTGEKVHPQRIENMLVNESPYISLALVLGSGKDYVSALIFPEETRLREWAQGEGIPGEDLAAHPAVGALFAAELQRINALIEVKYQRVRRAVLADRELSLARGELTPSGKVVRRTVLSHYQQETESLFSSSPSENVIEVVNVSRCQKV